jgi:hypothetical protein
MAAIRSASPGLPHLNREPLHLHRQPPPLMRPFPAICRRCKQPPPALLMRHRRLPWSASHNPSLGHPRPPTGVLGHGHGRAAQRSPPLAFPWPEQAPPVKRPRLLCFFPSGLSPFGDRWGQVDSGPRMTAPRVTQLSRRSGTPSELSRVPVILFLNFRIGLNHLKFISLAR